MIKTVGVAIIAFFVMSCSPAPGTKKVPYEPPKKNIKKPRFVTFSPKVDILFIVDDSASMGDFQDRLKDNAQLFMDLFLPIGFIDYHIAVTSSSENPGYGDKVDAGRLMTDSGYNYVDRNTPDGSDVLKNMLDVGLSGDIREKFLSIPQLVFSQENMKGVNKGFYRQDARLAVFILTDTKDWSLVKSQEFFDFLVNLKLGKVSDIFFAATLVIEEGPGCRPDDTPVTKFYEVAELFGEKGYIFDICKPDYGADLAEVASDILRDSLTIQLEEVPDVRTIKVKYGDIEVPNSPDQGWVYNPDTNEIFLSSGIDFSDFDPQNLDVTFDVIYKE